MYVLERTLAEFKGLWLLFFFNCIKSPDEWKVRFKRDIGIPRAVSQKFPLCMILVWLYVAYTCVYTCAPVHAHADTRVRCQVSSFTARPYSLRQGFLNEAEITVIYFFLLVFVFTVLVFGHKSPSDTPVSIPIPIPNTGVKVTCSHAQVLT